MNFIEKLNDENFDTYCYDMISNKYGCSPHQYLNYAEEDLNDGKTSRHLVNAISNTKKALHIRLEELSEGFGGRRKDLSNYPSMISFLRKCGVIAPRVLDKINKIRNKVEHEFYIPELKDVEVYLDVTTLFIESTRFWMVRQPYEIEICGRVSDESNEFLLKQISFNWKNAEISFNYTKENDRSKSYSKQIKHDNECYFPIVSMALKNAW